MTLAYVKYSFCDEIWYHILWQSQSFIASEVTNKLYLWKVDLDVFGRYIWRYAHHEHRIETSCRDTQCICSRKMWISWPKWTLWRFKTPAIWLFANSTNESITTPCLWLLFNWINWWQVHYPHRSPAIWKAFHAMTSSWIWWLLH